MSQTSDTASQRSPLSAWLDRAPIPAWPALTMEVILFAVIILFTIASRFYMLGERVMSHDESLHTYFSWLLYKGQGYTHNPMMHGPLQFHLIALSYFMFGASDFTARIPAATFSILTVAVVWFWRRYLGRVGALVAAGMVLISPMLSYYGRYTREDPYVGVSLFLMLYGILRYFETANPRYIYLISGALVIHYLTKETSFIYTAQILIFLAVYFIARVTQRPWANPEYFRPFLVALIVGVILVGATLGVVLLDEGAGTLGATETAVPANPTNPLDVPAAEAQSNSLLFIMAGLSAIAIAVVLYLLFRGYSLEGIRGERSFDLLILFGTLVLPQLAALPEHFAGWNSLDYSNEGIVRTALFLVPMTLIAIGIGLWWKMDVWWKAALIFWGPYLLLYTTIFTNGQGFFTGVVGSLGYWLEQHGVERGSQPWYYYTLVQIPMYEFLPALASLLALIFVLRGKHIPQDAPEEEHSIYINLHALLGYWTITSIVAFSWAGEKMPWLTFHMALPMALWGGWAVGKLIEAVDWETFKQKKGWLILLLTAVLLMSLFGVLRATLFTSTPPFQGQELAQLQATANFLFAMLAFLGSLAGLYVLLQSWHTRQVILVGSLALTALLGILTVRAMYRANYILYDSGQEYLVYAHGYTGVKDVMRQVDELSERVAGGKSMVVAYDNDVPWPFSWYLRDYTNARYFGNAPTRDLQDVPAIIVGDDNFGKIEPIVKQNFIQYEYIRMVWPNQDYFNLASKRLDPTQDFPEDYACKGALGWLRVFKSHDFSRLCRAVLDPKIREGIFYIWLNRDYTRYAEATGNQSLKPETWSPSDRMRLYVRKDIAAQIWNYGIGPAAVQQEVDPYE
ncbi:MAG: flippase activity-associated protein Agl23, partial [Anaerolineales bacterium]